MPDGGHDGGVVFFEEVSDFHEGSLEVLSDEKHRHLTRQDVFRLCDRPTRSSRLMP